MPYPKCLTIAGSDSGGGAGIQADLKTFAALGAYGMTAITALTAQNTVGVQGVLPVDADFVTAQLRSVIDDLGIDAAKTGMLHNAAVIRAVVETLPPEVPLVVDPVMVATSGDVLLEPEAVAAVKELLLPRATVITPNIPEAEILLAAPVTDLATAARALGAHCAAVLLKGGHGHEDTARDVLYIRDSDEIHILEAPRLDTRNTHGTGCTLSAALCAQLGLGLPLPAAATAAKTFLSRALADAQHEQLGQGSGPVHW